MQKLHCKIKKSLTHCAAALFAVALFAMLSACGDVEITEVTTTETVLVTTTEPEEITALTEVTTAAETTDIVTEETTTETAEPVFDTAVTLYESDLAEYQKDSPEYELYRLFSEDIPRVEETVAETAFDEEGNAVEVTSTYMRDGNAALYYKDIKSGKTVVIGADKQFSAASVIKCVYVYTLMVGADEGLVDLDEQVVYNESMFVKGTGKFKDVESGSVFTVRELISYTMRYSDNTAYGMLRACYGTEFFSPAMEKAGIEAVRYSKWWSADVVQYGEFFAVLAEYFESDSENAAWLKNEMTNSLQRVMLQNALSPDTVAHKYGWDEDSYCDGGVAFGEDGTYAVMFMSDLDGGHYVGANTRFIYAIGEQIKAMRESEAAETTAGETISAETAQEVTE